MLAMQNDDILKTFGKNLKAVRNNKHLSQETLAFEVNLIEHIFLFWKEV